MNRVTSSSCRLDSNDDTSHNSSLQIIQKSDIRHTLLLAGSQKFDNRDDHYGYGAEALGNCACTASLQDVVDAVSVVDLADFIVLIGCLLDVFELVVGRGSDDGHDTGSLSEDKTCDGDATSSLNRDSRN